MTIDATIIEGPEQSMRSLYMMGVIDTSGSMAGEKIASVNAAVRNIIPELREVENNNPGVKIFVQIIAFDDKARLIYPKPVPIANMNFVPLETGTYSNMGAALTLARDEFQAIEQSGEKLKQPVMFILSDGAVSKWQVPLKELLGTRLGNASQRFAFAVGKGADVNMLQNVVSSDQDGVFDIKDSGELAKKLIFATIKFVEDASRGKSSALGNDSMGFELPEISSSLIPDEAKITSNDLAKKLGLNNDVIF